MNFASDNTAGVAPEIMIALSQANEGFTLGYGNDAWNKRTEQRIAEIFKREVAVFLVTTGTASNALAIAHVAPPWGAVLCHEDAHINTDECGAPEFFGNGIKLIGLPGDGGKSPTTFSKPRWKSRNGARRTTSCRRSCRCRRRPKPARSISQARSAHWPISPMRTTWPCIWTAPDWAMRWHA